MTPSHVLQVGKFLPPPFAGIEAHVDQVIDTLSGVLPCELLASEVGWTLRQDVGRPYPVHLVRTLATVASTPLCPQMPGVMRRWAREHPNGVVHVHLPNPMADLSTWALPRRTPLVLTWHSDIVRQKRMLRLYQPMLDRLLDRADRIVVFTPKHLESSTQLQRVPSSKIRIVPPAIDPRRVALTAGAQAAAGRWRERWGDEVVIATVGRHIYYKGYAYLVEAMAEVPANVRLVMVGTGPLTPELRARAESLGIAHRVDFAGALPDDEMIGLLHACDMFTLPSIEPSEAFGLATAEAMLCGKPAVVCELGNGVNYLNRPGQTGLTTPPRDAQALAQALRTLAQDAGLRQRLGAGARAWVEQEFSPQRMREGLLSVYAELA